MTLGGAKRNIGEMVEYAADEYTAPQRGVIVRATTRAVYVRYEGYKRCKATPAEMLTLVPRYRTLTLGTAKENIGMAVYRVESKTGAMEWGTIVKVSLWAVMVRYGDDNFTTATRPELLTLRRDFITV